MVIKRIKTERTPYSFSAVAVKFYTYPISEARARKSHFSSQLFDDQRVFEISTVIPTDYNHEMLRLSNL